MVNPTIKPLPRDLDDFINAHGEEGLVVCSFGTTGNRLPLEIVHKFLNAFTRLPKMAFVSRFYVAPNETSEVPANVKLMSWIPQNDLLGHPSTKLFITHCGRNGQYEAIYHGVPMIGFPLFAEQEWNCERARYRGFGLTMDIRLFTADELVDTIQEVVYRNSNYSDSIRRASAIIRDEPMTGLQKGVYWIEHVIKHGGGRHLRPLSIDMPWYQLLMLDVLCLLTVLILVVFTAGFCCIRAAFKKCIGLYRLHENSRLKKTK